MDRRGKTVLISAYGRAHDAFDPVERWRLDRQSSAPLFQHRRELVKIAGLGNGMVAQPSNEFLGIGNYGLSEAEQGTELGALALERSFSGSEGEHLTGRGRRHIEPARQVGNHLDVNLRRRSREAAMVAEEQQHHGEAEAV